MVTGLRSFVVVMYLENIIPIMSLFYGVGMIGMATLCFFVGRGLQKAQSWARITAIILAIFLVLIISQSGWDHYIRNILYLLLSMIIVIYLVIRKNAPAGEILPIDNKIKVGIKGIKLAIISFVLSISGLIISLLIGGTGIFSSFFYGALFYPLYSLFAVLVPFLEIIAFVTSIKSIIQIKRNKLGGMGFAVTALVISSLFIIFFIILLVLFILLISCGNSCAPIL
ncbi:hypothetical protein HYT26_04840 [Candidatus Pacearchaeota archaeon]|nr:hypothetical protein [Candidatus Pacearchaeota archaeon]